MSLLATLRTKKQKRAAATMTVATDATHVRTQDPTVAKVAKVTVASPEKTPWAANDPAPPVPVTDPDLWCWPHTQAMNSNEVNIFMARLARFTARGLGHDEAERQVDALVIRDRKDDDRQLCLECTYLQGFGRWRCGNWRRSGMASDGLAFEFVLMLQRCPGFSPAIRTHDPAQIT